MSDYDKKNDLRRELEIQRILDERQQQADREQMKKTAQRYRAKPKVQEIFSTTEKKPRLKNENPLDLEKEAQEKQKTQETQKKNRSFRCGSWWTV